MGAGSVNADITVVISCFNYGEFLPEALQSLRRQADGAPRVIVVDDGSTEPHTTSVLSELRDDVELVRQENQGASRARNSGLARVETPYVLVLDADDRLTPDALQVLRRVLDHKPEIGYAYGYLRFFGERTGVMRMPPFDPWRLMFRHIVGPTALLRTEVVRATKGYDPAFPHYEDWEIWLHALAHGWHGYRVDQPTLEYRKHGASKFDSDRADYRKYYRLLRNKHSCLYEDLPAMAAASALSRPERLMYRYVWGLRPWPAAVEGALYKLFWRPS
ncbi:MAG: glycosyltransferase family 2 protein [Actinomycetota bacterium]|nr:glycosyltransferase family 2 protein [Actinomycetota bacterium]